MQEVVGEGAEYNERTGATDVLYCICRTNAQGWTIACDGGCEVREAKILWRDQCNSPAITGFQERDLASKH